MARAAEAKLNGQTFTIPDGMELELVAGPPMVNRPISADFDDEGRLYVTDSSGSNDKAQVQVQTRPHRVVRLEDIDGDGRFDKSVEFATDLMFPEGALWHAGSLYVAAPPQIWKLTDTDGDGKSDQREIWFDGKTLTNCANDLHGPFAGPDGWIYWCKGAFAEQTYERPGRPPLVTKASHIFRRRPEGGPIESVMAGGMDNPVDLVFMPSGERIFSATFLVHPGGGLRDGLTHAIYGGVYGKVHNVIDGLPRTGSIMPVLVHQGAAAPCGLARLESDGLGATYRDNLLTCLFNMRRVTRHTLTPRGASYESRDENLVVSDSLDFHPTDVLEDADGSVLVLDTGGWYKLCCPTSQLPKPDVLGAIYRVRHTGAKPPTDPRGRKVAWNTLDAAQLAALLADPRFAVRQRAERELGQRGAKAVGALRQVVSSSKNTAQRLAAVWTLTRIDDAAARDAVRAALADADENVRQAAIHSISVRQDKAAEPALLRILCGPSLTNRRAAAEALGRVGSPTAATALLAATAEVEDRNLEHSLTYAAIELGAAQEARAALGDQNPRVRRAALIALDQMPGNHLKLDDVRALLDADDPLVRETAGWIVEQHPDWAAGLVEYFQQTLARQAAASAPLEPWATRVARFAADESVQRMLGAALDDRDLKSAGHLAVLRAMTASKLKVLPATWQRPLANCLAARDASIRAAAVSTIAALAAAQLPDEFIAPLAAIGSDISFPVTMRLQALTAIPGGKRRLDAEQLRFLCDHLAATDEPLVRSLATDVLASVPLADEQLMTVATALPTTGPMELKRLIELFNKTGTLDVGVKLVASLSDCPSASTLAVDALERQLTPYGEAVRKQAQPLFDRIERENREKTGQLQAVLDLLPQADVRRGQQVFHSAKVACAACHAMGYLGGRVGPDLTRIGSIRSERDLIEAILFPSASFVRSYEPTTLVTTDGRVLNGVVKEETATELVLQLDAEKSQRIAVADIEERKPSAISIMPTGLEKQLSLAQLADLVKFLKERQ